MITKGQKISDRYEIIRSIGEGGMANVYLAYDVILERNVAIKVLRGDLANDEKFIRRFRREALAASNLSHPNIVKIYDVGEDQGNYYIVMEYIEGKTLKQLLKKRGKLTLSEAIDIMLQLTDGMSHAHDSYIIHRDLKPQNIMIQEDGAIKITDFGIAMALNSTQLTQTNSVMGSVHYLPPEQASGKGCTIKSDIYSMGIIFYELLSGSLPFKGESAVEIALKQMKEPLPSLRKDNPSIPQSVENIILKAAAKNPKNRYTDAKEMHQDLLTCLDDDRLNEDRYTYQYPEHEDIDETRVISSLEEIKEASSEEGVEDTDEIAHPIEDEVEKKTRKWIWILSILVGVIVVAMVVIFLVIPAVTEVPDVKIPDVTDMTVIEAEEELHEAGFEVASDVEEVESDQIKEGNVVKTNPAAGRSVKKGSTITLYVSKGVEQYEIEDYTDKNYIEVKTLLENVYGLVVTIEKKDIDLTGKDYTGQEIIGQSLAKGTKTEKGDQITLYIPNMDVYPDMVQESWTLDQAKEFCNKYNLNLTVIEKETSAYKEGTVIGQSRSAGTPIVEQASITITVATLPVISNPSAPADESGEDTDSE